MITPTFQFLTARFRALFVACLFGCLLSLGTSALAQPDVDGHPDSDAFYLIPPDTDDWTRHFHIGSIVGLNIGGSFRLNGDFNVSGNNPSKGIYDDGYVRKDQSGDSQYTSYWGYDNASQLNGEALTMHATTGYTASDSTDDSAGPSPGFDLAYGANYWYWKHARVGWELGFDLLPVSISDSRALSASATQTTYVFQTGNPYLPSAPYQGGPSGQGVVIANNPPTTSTATNTASVTGSRTLDAIIYSVRLGPTFDWDLGTHVGMSLSAGPVLGVVDGQYSYNEDITIAGGVAHNSGSFSSIQMEYGGYANATFTFHLTPSVDLYAGAQYMTMTDYTISNAGRSARLDLGGQVYISAGISWPF